MTGILYLAKNGLALYDDKTKGIFQLNFQPQAVKDLEIINVDQLNLYIKLFVDSNKIIPSALIMIVSNKMFFEKDFPPLSKEQQVNETQKFLDNIPFEVIASTAIGNEKTYKIVAANGHFIEGIRKSFEILGFPINIAIPAIAFGNIGEDLNQITIKIIFSKYPALKQYNLLKNEPINSQPSQKEPEGDVNSDKSKEKTNKKNLIAIGVFVLVIVILSIIVFFVLSSQKSSLKKAPLPNKSTTVPK